MGNEGNKIEFVFEEEHEKMRLDKALSLLADDISRSRIHGLIKDGAVFLDGIVASSPSAKVSAGQSVVIEVPDAVPAVPVAEDIPLDIVYEDDDLLVVNKPAGLVVHPGAGNHNGTLVNALLHHCRDSLSGIGGVLRPGIVHRLDKETSGLMLVAKNDKAHQGLAAQLEDRSLSRTYHAIVLGAPMPPRGEIDQPIGRHSQNRVKMAISPQGKDARTYYHVIKSKGEAASIVECKLETGRTHQIRVHMAHLGHPLIGDPLYGPQATKLASMLKKTDIAPEDIDFIHSFSRQALHARAIEFSHPITQKHLSFEASPPEDFSKLLKIIMK